jgi:hypothetical protein
MFHKNQITISLLSENRTCHSSNGQTLASDCSASGSIPCDIMLRFVVHELGL